MLARRLRGSGDWRRGEFLVLQMNARLELRAYEGDRMYGMAPCASNFFQVLYLPHLCARYPHCVSVDNMSPRCVSYLELICAVVPTGVRFNSINLRAAIPLLLQCPLFDGHSESMAHIRFVPVPYRSNFSSRSDIHLGQFIVLHRGGVQACAAWPTISVEQFEPA